MNILFVTSVSLITDDPAAGRALFVDALGLPLKQSVGDEYLYSDKIEGTKHFGVWPLAQAAESCFGTREWPQDRPIPQVSIELEVADEESVGEAAAELEGKGYALLHGPRTEPWGQTVARLQTSEGAIIGISYAPMLHND